MYQTLNKILESRFGLTIDFAELDVETASEHLQLHESKINEYRVKAGFNAFNSEYQKHYLICEALRKFLSEVAPNRKTKRTRKTVSEVAEKIGKGADMKSLLAENIQDIALYECLGHDPLKNGIVAGCVLLNEQKYRNIVSTTINTNTKYMPMVELLESYADRFEYTPNERKQFVFSAYNTVIKLGTDEDNVNE